MMRSQVAALLLTGGLLAASSVRAEVPFPANPRPCAGVPVEPPCLDATAFADYLFLAPGVLPDDYRGGEVWKFSSLPSGDAIDASAQELFGVKGASVDRAWQVTTGRPDVLIAVLDSGIRWGEPHARPGRQVLPQSRASCRRPRAATNAVDPHDRNGDGVFNVPRLPRRRRACAQDSRVSDLNGNGMIDPRI